LEFQEATDMAHRTAVFREDSARSRASLSYNHRREDRSIAMVRWPHSEGLPPASEALAGASSVDQIMPRNLKRRPVK
jgi:hypothetical protein